MQRSCILVCVANISNCRQAIYRAIEDCISSCEATYRLSCNLRLVPQLVSALSCLSRVRRGGHWPSLFNATQLQFMKRQLQFMAIANSWPVGSIHPRLRSKHIELPSGNISSCRRQHIELRSNISTQLWPEVATKLSLCTHCPTVDSRWLGCFS